MAEIRDSFVLYRSYMDAIWRLPDKDRQIEAVKGITDYGYYNKIPKSDDWAVQMIFDMAMPTLERSKSRWEAQKTRKNQGGRPQKISHYEIVRLKESGMSNRDIASQLGCSERYVAQVISDNRKAQETEEGDASEEPEPCWPPDDPGSPEPGAMYEDVTEQGYPACDEDYGCEPNVREPSELSYDEAEEISFMIEQGVPLSKIEEKYHLRPNSITKKFWHNYLEYDAAKYPRLKEWAEDIFHNGSTYHPELVKEKVNETPEEDTQPSDEVAGIDGVATDENNTGLAEGSNGKEVDDAPGRLPSELTLLEAEQVDHMLYIRRPYQEIEEKYNIKPGTLTEDFWDSYEENQVKGWFEQLTYIDEKEARHLTWLYGWLTDDKRHEKEREFNLPTGLMTPRFERYYSKYTLPAMRKAASEGRNVAGDVTGNNRMNEVTQEPQAEEPDETDFDEDAMEDLIEEKYGYMDDYPPF